MAFERGEIDPEAAVLAEAVQQWFEFYDVERTLHIDKLLCEAAMRIYQGGYHSVDEIATVLIATYVGILATKVNAPSSASVH